jgi:hypothetical protein
MRRREAAQLFSEICECVPDAFINSISLTPCNRSKEEFDLRINVSLDVKSFMNVQSIVSKHGMILKEDKGSLLIYGSPTKPTGMAIIA